MILITGGLGLVGSHTTRALLDLGEPCLVVRRSSTAPSALLTQDPLAQDRLAIEQVDVTDRGALLDLGERHEITGVVHLAGGFGLDPADPVGGARSGVAALLNIVEAAHRWGARRLTVASTIGVYDGDLASPLREDAPLPLTAQHSIPAAKKVDELLADYLGRAVGLEAVSLRIGGVWGPLGRVSSRFVAAPQLVHAAVEGRAPDFGSLRRPPHADDGIDLVYARDCGRAIALLQVAERLNHRVYNVASGRPTTNGELAAALERAVPGTKIDLPAGRDPEGLGRDVYLDIARLRDDTGFAPAYDTERAVADYVAWLRAGNPR